MTLVRTVWWCDGNDSESRLKCFEGEGRDEEVDIMSIDSSWAREGESRTMWGWVDDFILCLFL